MIEIQHHIVKEIPLLELVESSLKEHKLPTVVFYHGWTNTKAVVLTHGYELARKGFRVLLPDALYHGERVDSLPTEAHYVDFWKIVEANVNEYPLIMEDYIERGLTDSTKLGVTGLSMGGITTCALMSKYEKIKAAVCLMGTPACLDFTELILEQAGKQGIEVPTEIDDQLAELEKIDLSHRPERIAGRPFHFWHGTEDESVPYTPTFEFYENIKDLDFGKNVSFTTTDSGHKVPYAITCEMADFFAEKL